MQITSGDFVSVIALNPSIFGSRLRALYTVHNVYRHIEAVWKIALQKPGKLGGGTELAGDRVSLPRLRMS